MATIAWDDVAKGNNLMWRAPRNIRFNDNIVVREDEYAVFFRDGKALAYIDRPDRYALSSLDAPVIGPIMKLFGVQQEAQVYYLARRPFDGKFGSKQPYQFRDADFGMVNLRLFGEFRYRIKQPSNFINQFVGTLGLATAAAVEDRLREQLVAVIYDGLGEAKAKGLGVADLAANIMELEQIVLAKAGAQFDPYGIEIQKLSGLYVTLPEAVQAAVDQRAAMQITGTNYMQYQSGQAMRDAATNPAGGAGAGVGIGAGIAMGYQMAGQMGSQVGQPQPAPGQQTKPCPKCGTQNPVSMKFCGSCGARTEEGAECPKCKAFVAKGVKFCPECGTSMVATAKCVNGHDVPVGTKFCPECGGKVG